MHFGDKYVSALVQGLKKENHIKIFQLNNNGLSDKASLDLLQTISKHAKEIDLSNNKLGKEGCQNI